MALPSSRYIQWAERLPFYQGAVRAALAFELQAEGEADEAPAPAAAPAAGAPAIAGADMPPIPGLPPGAHVVHLNDAQAAAAMTQSPAAAAQGFPGVAYLK